MKVESNNGQEMIFWLVLRNFSVPRYYMGNSRMESTTF